jgi:hypothetical protein
VPVPIRFRALLKRRAGQTADIPTEIDDNRNHGSDMEHNIKKYARLAEVWKKMLGNGQMAGGGNRQKLSHALQESQKNGFKYGHK